MCPSVKGGGELGAFYIAGDGKPVEGCQQRGVKGVNPFLERSLWWQSKGMVVDRERIGTKKERQSRLQTIRV